MLYQFITDADTGNTVMLIGALLSFMLTFIALKLFEGKLPTDGGREFAVDGAKSIGKPRGAGIIFILVYFFISVFFSKISLENFLYHLLMIFCMLTGFFDDAASSPWGEMKKGILDLAVSVLTALVYIYHNGTEVHFALVGVTVRFNPVVFGILAVMLIWASINVTNCCDGVDGLCGTLSITSIVSIFALSRLIGTSENIGAGVLFMVMVLLAYLWYNSTPSRLLMGDAGSRAIGVYLAIIVLRSGSPFMYLILCLIIFLDGGLGLFKVTVIRVLKFNPMKNIRTPLHDHFRKTSGWSNTQVVNRFFILQVLISLIALGLVK